MIPITAGHNDYAQNLASRLVAEGLRASADLGSDRMNAKIRAAQLMKTPYMLVVGDQEVSNGTVSLRRRDGSRQDGMAAGEFVALVKERIRTRSREL